MPSLLKILFSTMVSLLKGGTALELGSVFLLETTLVCSYTAAMVGFKVVNVLYCQKLPTDSY